MWKADTEFYLESTDKLTNDITFVFPRYYRGGKLNNTYYRIVSSENKFYNENKVIDENNNLKVKIPAPNKNKASVFLHTAFFNRLSDPFEVIVPESSYQIDLTAIDQEIKDKANEIISENTDKPNYYKIGKFVHSHIQYDIDYVGSDMSIKEIYERKIGVCHHYTLLYNAMLNSIGIKTLYISGWAFQNEEISGNKSSLAHAWTAAYIEDKGWIELDATWGLFEGIPAGHIIKNFGSDTYYYLTSHSSNVNINFEKNPLIQMITDPEKMIDPYPPIDDGKEEEEEEEENEEENKEKGEENKEEEKDENKEEEKDENKEEDKTDERKEDKTDEKKDDKTIDNIKDKTDEKKDDKTIDNKEDKTDENKKDNTDGENNESDNLNNNDVNKSDDAENSAKINYMNIYIGFIIIYLGL